eukprot:GHVR01054821.1.p1 GENE.GHVR01054821.1~~GHVR01054821.1.p1  ORF type:complete len:595 (-),score=73.69 GHVR01054821.1:146-1930(-)
MSQFLTMLKQFLFLLTLQTGVAVDNYKITKAVQKGKLVFEARSLQSDKTVIVKVLNPTLLNEYELMAPNNKESEFIVKRLGKGKCSDIIAKKQNFNDNIWNLLRNNVCMVFQKYKMDAFKFLTQTDLTQSAKVKYTWVKDLLSVLKFLDYNNIIHNDVKPENIFVTDDNRPLLGDFGFAVDVSEIKDTSTDGTPAYFSFARADAFLKRGFTTPGESHTSKEDVFAAGVVIYIMCFKEFLFFPEESEKGDHDQKVANKAKEFNWDNSLEGLKKQNKKGCRIKNRLGYTIDEWGLLGDMLRKDSEKRLSAKALLDKYFKYEIKAYNKNTKRFEGIASGSDETVIVKPVDPEYPNEYDLMSPNEKTSEFIVQRLNKGNCENIISNYDDYYLSDKDNGLIGKGCMIFKKYKSDALAIITQTEREPVLALTPELKYMWVKELLIALEFLDNNKIIHNDVKPDNIFITDDNHIRLGEFGFAVYAPNSVDFSTSGTPAYFSSERAEDYLKQVDDTKGHTSKADVFAAGVVMYEICFERFLVINAEQAATFDFESFDKTTSCVMKNINGKTIDEWSLLGDMLRKDSEKRLSAKALLDKYFIQ